MINSKRIVTFTLTAMLGWTLSTSLTYSMEQIPSVIGQPHQAVQFEQTLRVLSQNPSTSEGKAAKQALQVYETTSGNPLLKGRAALQAYRIALTAETQGSQGHKEEIAELKKQVEVEKKKVEDFERKAENFQRDAGVFVAELAKIRYSAYHTPIIYQEQLKLIIDSATAIQNLIVQFVEDGKIDVLSRYLRLPIVTQQDLDTKEKGVLIKWGEIKPYLMASFKVIEDSINYNVGAGKIIKKSVDAEILTENLKNLFAEINSLNNIHEIIAFFSDSRVFDNLAKNIESLLGVPGKTVPGKLVAEVSKQPVFELCSHLYDLHDFIVQAKILEEFQDKREDYFSTVSPYNKVKLPKYKLDQLSRDITEYEANLTSFEILSTKSTHHINLAELQQKVQKNNLEKKKAEEFIKTIINSYELDFKNAVYKASTKSYVDKLYNALVGEIFEKVMNNQRISNLGKENKDYANNVKIMEALLNEFITQRRYILYNFASNHPTDVIQFMVQYWQKMGKPDVDPLFKQHENLGAQIKYLSDIVEKLPPGLQVIEDFTKRYAEAIQLHQDFQEELRQIGDALHTMTVPDWAEELSDQSVENLHVVKENLREVVLAQNYLNVAPSLRAESFNYGLGSLGLKVQGTWVKAKVQHELFAKAHEAYIKARDAILKVTQKPLDTNYIEIDFNIAPQIKSGSSSGGPSDGPVVPVLRGGPSGGPRGGGMPASSTNYSELRGEYMGEHSHLTEKMMSELEGEYKGLENHLMEYDKLTKDRNFFDILSKYAKKYPNFRDMYLKYSTIYPNFFLLLRVVNDNIKNSKEQKFSAEVFVTSLDYTKALNGATSLLMDQINAKIASVLKDPQINKLPQRQQNKVKYFILYSLAKGLMQRTEESYKHLDIPLMTPMEAIISIEEDFEHLIKDVPTLIQQSSTFDRTTAKF